MLFQLPKFGIGLVFWVTVVVDSSAVYVSSFNFSPCVCVVSPLTECIISTTKKVQDKQKYITYN
jgi:hypothetical protein